jgi:glycosyltransferase involved in cell wall biosynthesis
MAESKLVYIALVDHEIGGVEQKILGQFDALKSHGVSIHLVLVSNRPLSEVFRHQIESRPGIVHLLFNVHTNFLQKRFKKFEFILNHLSQYKSAETTIYMRFPAADPASYLFFKQVKQLGFRLYTEHQQIENPYRQFNFIKGYFLIAVLDFLYGKSIRKLIDGFVGVCQDITDFEASYLRHQVKQYLTLGNGVHVGAFPARIPLQSSSDLEIIFVGAGYRTNGLHRLIESRKNAIGNGNSQSLLVHVVGDSNEMQYNKDLVLKYGLEKEFVFYGFQKHKDYEHLFNTSHMAMGTLSFSRIGLHSASTLKLREYCSRGIPFFYAGDDIDFPDDFPYHLKLADNDLPFDYELLEDFNRKMQFAENVTEEMRTYAKYFLDWTQKMNKLKDFLLED